MDGREAAVNRNTPTLKVVDNRGLIVRDITYHRHPDTLDVTDALITRHGYDGRGLLTQSADPRLYEAGLTNFTYATDLAGNVLSTRSADAGTAVALNDAAGRPLVRVSAICTTHTWHYEKANTLGRPLAVTEQAAGEATRVPERFVYADNTPANQDLNLAGHCVHRYDTAGLLMTDSVALTAGPLSITRQLLKDADAADTQADWQGMDACAWNALLAAESHRTLTTPDATGNVLTSTDAAGHLQRVTYDTAGSLKGSWLTVKGAKEQAIVISLTYSPSGQKLREVHGNTLVTTYGYAPQTQRLTSIRTQRPAGRTAVAKRLQDLHYRYDPVGNVLAVSNAAEPTRVWGNQRVEPQNTYVYNSLYHLVSATGREMANADHGTYTNYTRTFHYDSSGNLTQTRQSARATQNSFTTAITVSDRSNRAVLSTFTENPAEVEALFTASGHQRQLHPRQTLAWTPRGQLQRVSPVVRDGAADDQEHYRYDAGSQRVLKVSAQHANGRTLAQRVVYLPGLELRTTRNGGMEQEDLQVMCVGETGRAQVRLLHWEHGKPAGIDNDQLRYSYDNLTGSCGLEVDGDGNVISQEEYYPYGGTAVWTARSAVEADYKTLRYSGKERDATGLYYYGHRYYQPWAGRWLSADPAGTVDGLNLFWMVRNNPGSYVDVHGLVGESPQAGGSQGGAHRVLRRGLGQFDTAERNQVLQAIKTAREVLDKVTQPRLALPEREMMNFFGPDYREKIGEIKEAWRKTNQLLAEYDSPYPGHEKFYRATGPNSNMNAEIRRGDFQGKVLIHDMFFHDIVQDEERAATIIHELSHLRRASHVTSVGVGTYDFFI